MLCIALPLSNRGPLRNFQNPWLQHTVIVSKQFLNITKKSPKNLPNSLQAGFFLQFLTASFGIPQSLTSRLTHTVILSSFSKHKMNFIPTLEVNKFI